ncbi:hypothetical protein [Micromonospora psammae]|uniref:hypothetical protein n=1 Tax=Micromonospora sp. CPCC 205556 TaxID=3122398 RepID=UPI002FEF4864
MQVRLSAPWTDPDGTVRSPGETVDVDAVTLARLEEHGMVENPDGQSAADNTTTSTTTSTDPQKIGPGPGTPPEKIGPGPGAPPADDTTK